MAGYTYSFGPTVDGWVAHVDPMGRAAWELALDGGGADEFRAVAAAPDGGCILALLTRSIAAAFVGPESLQVGRGMH